MEKEKKKNYRPLPAKRPAAAMFVLFVPKIESSLHGARIFLVLGSSNLSARKILSLGRS